ncbi:6083_t:CDS:2 [Funneliformis geosporum]|nr:6083_t:CDS:2 [Funneliformis geosporum]
MLNSLNTKKRNFTNFQFQVYQTCAQIPLGYVSTYKEIARFLHSSPRAVGQALRNNPFSATAVPCHRVIESNFFLGGYRGYLQKDLRKDRIFTVFAKV